MKRQRKGKSKVPDKSKQEQRDLAEQALKSLAEITIDIAPDSRAEATFRYSFDLKSPKADLLGDLLEQIYPEPPRGPGRPVNAALDEVWIPKLAALDGRGYEHLSEEYDPSAKTHEEAFERLRDYHRRKLPLIKRQITLNKIK